MATYPRRVRASLVHDSLTGDYWQVERVSLVPGASWRNRHLWAWRTAWLDFID